MRVLISTSAMALVASLLFTACEAGITSQPSAANNAATAPPASVAPSPASDLSPVVGWTLDNDGTPSTGDLVVEPSGSYAFADGALALDGWTGSATTSTPGPVDLTSSFSVSAWVSYQGPRGRDRYAPAVSQLGKTTGLFHLGIGDHRWWFMMKNQDANGAAMFGAKGAIATEDDGKWVHLVGVHDREARLLHLYVNGEHAAETAFTMPVIAGGPLAIGRAEPAGAPGTFFKGAIRDVAVYEGVLSAEQIAGMYTSTAPTAAPPAAPKPDPADYANGVLNGTWDYVMTAADRAILEPGLEADYGRDADDLRIRLGFDDSEWWHGFVFDGQLWLLDGVPEGDGGTLRIDGDTLTTFNPHVKAEVTLRWKVDDDKLTFEVIRECLGEGVELRCHDRTGILTEDPLLITVWEHTFVRSGDDPSY